jgi:hypothetical protein
MENHRHGRQSEITSASLGVASLTIRITEFHTVLKILV